MKIDSSGSARLADPAANCMGVLRLVLALLVILSHAFLCGSFGPDPLLVFSQHHIDWGSFAVHGFFVLSGFLVAQSWDRLKSSRKFLANRVLRIMPGYWLCLLLTAVVLAPCLWALLDKSGSYWHSDPSPFTYLTKNWLLVQKQRDIGSLTSGLGVPHYFNTSLWTLASEFACYVGVLCLGLVGVMRRRSWWLIAVLCLFYANAQSVADEDLLNPLVGKASDLLRCGHCLVELAGILAVLKACRHHRVCGGRGSDWTWSLP